MNRGAKKNLISNKEYFLAFTNRMKLATDQPSPFLNALFEKESLEFVSVAIQIAMREFGCLPAALARHIQNSTNFDYLVQLEKQVPAQTVNLRSFALALARRLQQLLRDEPGGQSVPSAQRAQILNNLALRLADLGDLYEGVTCAEQGLAAAESAADRDPLQFSLQATLLNTLASIRGQLRDFSGAARAANEAVEIYKWLVKAGDLSYQPSLAVSLKHRSDWRAKLSNSTVPAALQDARDAIAIYQQEHRVAQATLHGYSSDRADGFPEAAEKERTLKHGLAAAMTSLSNRLLAAGHWTEARAAAEASQQFFHELYAANPDRFRPACAAALENLAFCLLAAGEAALALEFAGQAASHYVTLKKLQPGLTTPDLDDLLSSLQTLSPHPPFSPLASSESIHAE